MKSSDSAAYVLKSCLSGTAFHLICNVDDNLEDMLRQLDETYGKPSKLMNVILNDIKRFRAIVESDYEQLTEFVNLVQKS